MKAATLKAISGMFAVALVAIAYFVYGCDQASIYPLVGAILVLSGKEAYEFLAIKNGGK